MTGNNEPLTPQAILIKDGDNEDEFAPDLSDYNMLITGEIAAANGLVAAALFQAGSKWSTWCLSFTMNPQVPNQPIVYAEDPDQSRRTEDSSIAFTW